MDNEVIVVYVNGKRRTWSKQDYLDYKAQVFWF